MKNWMAFCSDVCKKYSDLKSIKEIAERDFDNCKVYPDSIHILDKEILFIAIDGSSKVLVIYGEGEAFRSFSGDVVPVGNKKARVCPLNSQNSIVLRKLFPYTAPSSYKGRDITIGLGDRLGLATAGHIRLIKGLPVFPVFAQQSIRELNLTGRTYGDVLAAASWAVFQEGYTSGFGADGDHLKTASEVQMALDCGFTMITLDCSEHINNSAATLPQDEVDRIYMSLPAQQRSYLEGKYLNRRFFLKDGVYIEFTPEDLRRTVLIYSKAINFTLDIYKNIIQKHDRPIDFEMSIDETLTPTTPESHYFVASELIDGGVSIANLAPRFCGEFQKGIDYIGDISQFTKEFILHNDIANHFGYRISIHSGSDKFAVFPIIGEKTGGRYHLKTAGTNWLEAVRVIARVNPVLYRKMHKFAVSNLSEAKKYYHISAKLENVPDIDKMADSELPLLMDIEDSRQVLHITYGLILLAKNPDGSPAFRNDIYETLNKHEAEYYDALKKHIGKHLKLLGIIK